MNRVIFFFIVLMAMVSRRTFAVVDTSTTIGTNGDLYCVVDLSAGYTATNYPVTFLSEIPDGGWSDEYKTTKLVLRRIPAGEFMLQNTTNAILTKSYYIGIFEITQKQWQLVIGDWIQDFSYFVRYAGDTRPADACSYDTIRGNKDGLSWPYSDEVDSNSFLYRLRTKTGLRFDLPTEAQWEYAARANATNGIYYAQQTKESDVLGKANYRYFHTAPYTEHGVVGSLPPNDWGLYDMCGNVWEWCLDAAYTDTTGCYTSTGLVIREPDIRDVLVFGGKDPKGAETDAFNRRIRMMRGGGWYSTWYSCYSGVRRTLSSNLCQDPNYFEWDCGFRLVVGCDHKLDLNVTVSANEGGSVMGGGLYDYGDTAKITATPAAGYRFLGWTGASTSSEETIYEYVNGAKTYTAVFGLLSPTCAVTRTMFDRVDLTWESMPWAKHYKIYRSTDTIRPESPFIVLENTAIACSDSSALPGTEYYYWVEAIGNSGSSFSSRANGLRRKLAIIGLSISGGSDTIFSGESAQFECKVFRNDKSYETVAPEWSIEEGGAYATVSTDGVVAGLDVGDQSRTVVLAARYLEDGVEKAVKRNITIAVVDEKYSDWELERVDGGLKIVSIPSGCVGANVEIPEYICGVPVEIIGSSAFGYRSSVIKTVVIPPTVKEFGSAFAGCGMTEIIIPDSVTNIAAGAFNGCKQLQYVSFGTNVVSIGARAFYQCSALKDVNLPDNVQVVPEECFSECEKLGRVRMGQSLKRIDQEAFYKCTSLTNVMFNSKLEIIDAKAFGYCSALCAADMPDSVEAVGRFAFTSSGIQTVRLPRRLRTIEAFAFSCCESLMNVEWGCRLESIEQSAFYGCRALTELSIPHTVTNFGTCAFEDCTALTSLTLPIGINRFNYMVVRGCENLARLIFEGDRPEEISYDKPAITKRYAYSGNTTWAKQIKNGSAIPITKEKYPVYFEMNTGVDDPETIEVASGEVIDKFPDPKSEGKTLIGWFTERQAGLQWTNDMTVNCPIKLFAHWGYTIQYDGLCEATSDNPNFYLPGDKIVFSTPMRKGYSFLGWSPSCLMGSEKGQVKVMANWRANTYRIRFHSNGGAWSMSDQECVFDQPCNLSKNLFMKEYFSFDGWATNENGVAVYADAQEVSNLTETDSGVVNLYAAWRIKYVPTPTLTANAGRPFTNSFCTVSLEHDFDDAIIYYSTNGLPPCLIEGCRYTAPFEITETTEVQAFAAWNGMTSVVAAVTITKQSRSLPDLGENPSAAAVAEALSDLTDQRIVERIDQSNYSDFRTWANKVKAKGGSSAIGLDAVKSANNVWLSFALGSESLIDTVPTNGQIRVDNFEPTAESGKFDFTVSIEDVVVGSEATVENLKKVFGLEGGTTLDALSSTNIDISFGTPENGKVKFTAGPNAKYAGAKTFFMKVKVMP